MLTSALTEQMGSGLLLFAVAGGNKLINLYGIITPPPRPTADCRGATAAAVVHTTRPSCRPASGLPVSQTRSWLGRLRGQKPPRLLSRRQMLSAW